MGGGGGMGSKFKAPSTCVTGTCDDMGLLLFPPPLSSCEKAVEESGSKGKGSEG